MSENTQPTGLLTKILLPIAIIEAAVIVFLLIQLNDKKVQVTTLTQTVEVKTSEVELKAQELENLGLQFERIKEERAKLGLANDSLDAQISNLRSKVADLRKSGVLNASKRKELEQMVTKMREEITKRDQEIADLQAQNDSLNTDLTVTKSEKAKLGDSLNSISSKKQDLEGKLAYASILKAQLIKITILKSNGKEVDDDEYKASKIDKLKIGFALADNKAAQQNDKEVYLRLINPMGEDFGDPANGGGSIGLATGNSIKYLQKQTFKFDNTNQSLTFISLSGLQYSSGSYTVELYCEGNKIGSSTFKVK